MGEVLAFRPGGKKPGAGKSTLCREGHHRWKVETKSRFDVKQGKLVTVYRCERCGRMKTTAH
ncbi:MAG: hypothetical protein CMN84_05395 [Spongiibacteraceae bacterium]|jgi:hypothetical protein|nr:hypothetical protein [Spongiibacteraceae bacterium]